MADLALERAAGGLVAGIDEAGRGPWAGPVVAAAVAFDGGPLPRAITEGVTDSKRLSAARRAELFAVLGDHARIGIGLASPGEIDALNILQATLQAMARALARLGVTPTLALVDGNQAPDLPCPVRTVVGGDGLSLSIAAASIVAKVTRDRLMTELDARHPGYGWDHNFGYGTPLHRAALKRLGITPQHRRTFRPVRERLEESLDSRG